MKNTLFRNRRNKHKGYTLAEVLVVVAIIIILFAVAVPAVFRIQKNMRQTELDDKAETIYVSVQNKLSKMRAAGEDLSSITTRTKSVSVWKNNAKAPADVSYITSGDLDGAGSDEVDQTLVNELMGEDSVDSSLAQNHWVVEFDPSSAVVYAVFYSEEKVDCAEKYCSSTADVFQDYRDNEENDHRQNRLDDGARVGYYGRAVGTDSGETVKIIYPTLTVTNAEKLTVKVTCTLPDSVSADQLVYKLEIEDTAGNKNTAYYSYGAVNATITKTIGSTSLLHAQTITKSLTGNTCTLDLTLDDLTAENTRFCKLYGNESSNTVKLLSGTPIKITATVMCPGNSTVTDNFSDTVITNSLFADDNCMSESRLNQNYGSSEDAGNIAVVSFGRHLQNLDQSSDVDSCVKYVCQGANINFSEDNSRKNEYDWYKTYAKSDTSGYFNGQWVDINDASSENAAPNFKPITNPNLKSFSGSETIISEGSVEVKNYQIENLRVYTASAAAAESNSDAGLFRTLSADQQVTNVIMTGTSAVAAGAGTSAGAIAGTVSDGAQITGCQVYLTADDIGSGTDKKTNEYIRISGKTAGGLIGAVTGGTVRIAKSSCSTVIGSYPDSAVTRDANAKSDPKPIESISSFDTEISGGLIGSVSSAATVDILESYADNYLAGTITGGLVGQGSGNLTIDSCYAAGYMSFSDVENSAGLVLTAKSITTSYSIARGLYLKSGVTLYNKTSDCTSGSIYYFSTPDEVTDDALAVLNGSSVTGEDKFARVTGIETYKLLGQTNTYDYPVLKAIAQYGDCDDDLEGTYDAERRNFHFSSDYLKENGAEWEVTDWGKGFDIQIYNYETDNLFNVSDQDITYSVTVSDGWIQSVGGSSGTSYTIEKGPDRHSQTLHIAAGNAVTGGSVTVTVTSSSPYSKTLYATFKVIGKKLPDYTIRDQKDGSVLITVKTNNYSGAVTIKWDASEYTPDNADSLLRKFVNSNTGSDGLSYGTITVEGNSTYSFRFIRLAGNDLSGAESADQDGSGTTITLK